MKKPTKKKLALDKENEKRMQKNLQKCGICDRSVRTNQQHISCKRCETTFHLTCSGLEQAISDYYCMGCMGNELEISRTLERSISISDSDTDTGMEATPKKDNEMFTPPDGEPTIFNVPNDAALPKQQDTVIDDESSEEDPEENKKEGENEEPMMNLETPTFTIPEELSSSSIIEEASEELQETGKEPLKTSEESPIINKEPMEIIQESQPSQSQPRTPSTEHPMSTQELSVHTIDTTMCASDDSSDDSCEDSSDDPDWSARSEVENEDEGAEDTSSSSDGDETTEIMSQINNQTAEFEKYIAGSQNLHTHETTREEMEKDDVDTSGIETEPAATDESNPNSGIETEPAAADESNPNSDKKKSETELADDEGMKQSQFTKMTDKVTNEVEYQCSMCNKTSVSIGGIKNHISRTHKITVATKEKSVCCKCKNRIHKDSDAGTCIQCNGKEHYRCTKTSKDSENEYKNGTLSFICTLCCAPGLWESSPDGIEIEDATEEGNKRKENDEIKASCKDKNNKEQEKQEEEEETEEGGERKSLEPHYYDDEIKKYVKREEAIIREANKIATDNTKLVQEINVMDIEIKKLKQALSTVRGNNKLLAVEMNRLKAENQNTTAANKKYQIEKKNIEMTHRKAQEIALNMKKKLSTTVKEAKDLIRTKNEEIGYLVKSNEKLRAENQSYLEINNNIKNARRKSRGKPVQNYGSRSLKQPVTEYEDVEDIGYDDVENEKLEDTDEFLYDYEFTENDEASGNYQESEIDDYEYNELTHGDDDEENNNEWLQIGGNKHWVDDEHQLDYADSADDGYVAQESPQTNVVRYCHFYNHRDECTRKNCQFVHDIAPICNNYMNGRCRRRFCGYSHPDLSDEEEDTIIQSTFQNRRPLQPGEPKKTSNTKDQLRPNQLHRNYDNASISISNQKRVVTWQNSPQIKINQVRRTRWKNPSETKLTDVNTQKRKILNMH